MIKFHKRRNGEYVSVKAHLMDLQLVSKIEGCTCFVAKAVWTVNAKSHVISAV